MAGSLFDSAAGAVSDIFGGVGDILSGDMKAKSLNIQAEGLRLRASGDLAEASNYDLATNLANQNEAYTKTSTALQQMQLERQTTMQIGSQRADIGGAGLAASGSSLDILADSARQGAMAKEVLGQQGLITEAGYQEQAQSYTTMAGAARTAAAGEQNMASETDSLASEARTAANVSAAGKFISGGLKAIPLVAAAFAL